MDGWMNGCLYLTLKQSQLSDPQQCRAERTCLGRLVRVCVCVCVFEILENGRIKNLFFFLIRASSWEQSRLLRSTWCSVSKSVFYRV